MFNWLVQTEGEIEVRSLFDDLGIRDKQQVVRIFICIYSILDYNLVAISCKFILQYHILCKFAGFKSVKDDI